jgi:hypothetical protein
VVGLDNLAGTTMMDAFDQFTAKECVNRGLARLTMGATDLDLMKAASVRLPKSVSKAALNAVTRMLAAELRRTEFW